MTTKAKKTPAKGRVSAVGSGRLVLPPMAMRLTIDANKGTPALAGMLARLLVEAGATVTLGDSRIDLSKTRPNLAGLNVHIDRLTWVRDEEAARWGSSLQNR
jgi:hypothetical protein